MDANDVIDSYVYDVARRLPAAKRNDVAFELRALLRDDVRTRAAAEGRPADAAFATELVREFGRPGETAARYHPPFTLVAPSDTWSFVVAALSGGAVLSVLLYPTAAQTYAESSQRTSVAFLAWLGLLLLGFAGKNLYLRRKPSALPWKPRAVRGSDRAGRVAGGALVLLWAAFLALYLAPGPVVAALSFGRVSAATLRYSDSFAGEWRMPWLVGIVLLLIALHVLVAVRGRWQPLTRWALILLLAEVAIQLGWHSRYGDVFANARTDDRLIPALAVTSGVLILWAGYLAYRQLTRVDPAPVLVQGVQGVQRPSGPKTP